MGTELPHPRLKRLRQQPIVGIQEHQVFPPGVTDPCVARAGEPLVLLANAAHPGIASGYLRGVVGRAIVYYKDLKVRVALGEDALYRFAEEVGLVVAGNNHRDQRPLPRVPLFLRPERVVERVVAQGLLGIPPLVVALRHSPSTLLRSWLTPLLADFRILGTNLLCDSRSRFCIRRSNFRMRFLSTCTSWRFSSKALSDARVSSNSLSCHS